MSEHGLTREPQRFVCKSGCYSTKIEGFLDVMQPHVEGEWILMTDYAVLRAERDALKAEVETIKERAATALASQARFAGEQSNEIADLTRQRAEVTRHWKEESHLATERFHRIQYLEKELAARNDENAHANETTRRTLFDGIKARDIQIQALEKKLAERAPVWTTEKPIVPGWYCRKYDSSGMVLEEVVQVVGCGSQLEMAGYGGIILAATGEWSGPLTPPQERGAR